MKRVVGQLELESNRIRALGAPAGRVVDSESLAAHIRFDDAGRYRPLSGAKTLPTGWEVSLNSTFHEADAIEAVYPLATVHQRQRAAGTLRIVGLDEVLRRQSGRYEDSSALSPAGRTLVVRTVCGECIRQPVWDGVSCSSEDIPCPEPCSVLVAFCREAALWESSPPPPVPPDATVAWAAFDEPGNELRERYLAGMHARD